MIQEKVKCMLGMEMKMANEEDAYRNYCQEGSR